MDKIIKLTSKQGGPFKKGTSNNLIDFDIPADGTYDFSDSQVNLVGVVSGVVSTEPVTAVTGYPSAFKVVVNHTEENRSVYNIAMIKNCRMTSELKGSLEDVRRVDILRQNLNEYTLTTDEKQSLQYSSLRQMKNSNTARSSIFQEIHNDGTIPSRNVPAVIPVKLSQMFELGKLMAYPAVNMGRTRIQCELDLNKFVVGVSQDAIAGYTKMADITGADAPIQTLISKASYDNNIENSPYFVGGLYNIAGTTNTDDGADDVFGTAAANPMGTDGLLTLVADPSQYIVGGGVTIDVKSSADDTARTFTFVGIDNNGNAVNEDVGGTDSTYSSTTIPFAYLTSVSIDGASAGTLQVGFSAVANQTMMRTITSISYDHTGIQTIAWNSPLIANMPATKTLVDIVVTPATVDVTSATLDVMRAELVLKKVANPPKPPNQLSYMSWSTEQINGNASTNFQRMFSIEPSAVNVMLMFPKNDLFSQNTDLQSYRLRLNNEDLTNRDISVVSPRDPLYYDRLGMSLLNSGYPFSNAYEQNLNCNADSSDGGVTISDYKLTLVSNPLPITSGDKLLQVNLTLDGGGLEQLVLFKQNIKTIVV
jgi:hypothetical protein